ncbi:probable receptor-like serine/threonine-protein kinase At4g34500 [Rutidosis leptorrhynchoides]|uniref:probable receptor-like serine/threonine-protein kinase At4g34500 n=1 Tax=Rutidosis leptorrhynchoides TaxID=125765 RepID=UPI003A9A6200
MLTTCKHRNIVTLLGFCDEDSEMILVYENTIKQYLSKYWRDIHKPIVTWSERLRISIDVAHGLKYLHYEMEDEKVIIHCNIRSRTNAIDENMEAQIDNFGKSVFLYPYQDDRTLHLGDIIDTQGYVDPEYEKTGKLKRESDIYSFGVLLCEILCGKLADSANCKESDEGLANMVRRCFHEGTVKDMVDPTIKEESGVGFTLNRGPNKNSLDAFLKILDACFVETQDKHPTIDFVIEELNKALMFQENNKDALRISFEDIQLATENFHVKNYVGGGGFGKVYKGKLPQSDNTIVAKLLDTRGYCDVEDAKIVVCEYATRGSLDRYLTDSCLNWMKRLNICIDIATALDFLHRGIGLQTLVIHRDIKTANILLTGDWNGKLADFGFSLISAIHKETDYVIDRACGTPGYVDPLYLKLGFLTKESDIYSFGVVLFEILCGRSTFETHKQERMHLPSFIKHNFENGKHDEVVFEKLKTQIMPEALIVFYTIAYRCLHENREARPTSEVVVEQLKKALELQVIKMCRGDEIFTEKSTSYQLQDQKSNVAA